MVEIELKYDSSTTVSHFDAEGLVPTAATCTVYRPDGTVLSSPTVTISSINTHANSPSNATMLDLDSITGVTVGTKLAVTSYGVTYVCTVSRIDGTHAYLQEALPIAPVNNDTVKGITMTASVPAAGTGAIGGNYRIAWSYSNVSTSRQAAYQAAVVRWAWTAPVSGADVRSVLTNSYQERKSEAFCDRVAQLVNERIRGAVQRTGRRPWLYLSGLVFTEAARQGIRYALAEEGVYPGGDAISALRELRFAFDDAIAQALTAAAYDSNADGATEAGVPTQAALYTLQAVR